MACSKEGASELVDLAVELKEKCEMLVSLTVGSQVEKAREIAGQIDELIREFERRIQPI